MSYPYDQLNEARSDPPSGESGTEYQTSYTGPSLEIGWFPTAMLAIVFALIFPLVVFLGREAEIGCGFSQKVITAIIWIFLILGGVAGFYFGPEELKNGLAASMVLVCVLILFNLLVLWD